MKLLHAVLSCSLILALTGFASAAPVKHPSPDPAPAHAPAGPPGLMPYAKFTKGATAQRGLFTIWRKAGSVAIELKPDQLGKDYVELGVPVNGIGEGLFSGITDLQNCRIIRFVRQDDRVAILFPTTLFLATPGSPQALSVEAGTAATVAGVAKVLSVDATNGDVVFDASPFLQDITNVADFLTMLNGGRQLNPLGSYRLDPQATYFGTTKSFPDNAIINVEQTFSTMNPVGVNVPPDGRNLQIELQYNIAALPQDDTYMPRIYDDRVGYFVNAHLNFNGDNSYNKDLNYIVRWNIQPSDPSKRVSPAKKPLVWYLSNTIPYQYRDPVRKALLTWNNAFLPLGISNAVVVKDQPSDPNFDPDDIRYNVIRWLSEAQGGFAEAQLLYNPYTGEMIKSGVVVDSDLMRFGKFQYPVLVQPQHLAPNADATLVSPMNRLAALGADTYLAGEQRQFTYGLTALAIRRGERGFYVPQKFADEFLESIVLHESGHDWGLRHNFIGSEAYTAKELQSKAFTSRYGVASSVMEYSPINLWPKGTRQGDYFQTVLGPYDYYVIHWGYARIPGATTPQAEVATLDRWASKWNQPDYRWSSDEDVSWFNGAGVDPRNQQWDLTNDNIGWCQTQMSMARRLISHVGSRFPHAQAPFDDLQTAFGSLLGSYTSCGEIVSRYLGGEYVSRSLRGDPHAKLPLSPVPLATQRRAFKVLERGLFSAQAWDFSPQLLRQAVTQYRFDDWMGNLPLRHDIPVEEIALGTQRVVINRLFTPVTLQRLDDMNFKYKPGTTMGLADLFTWMQSAVYGDLGHARGSVPLVRRDLQRSYAALLSRLANAPPIGTPDDAQALARYELGALHAQLQGVLRRGRFDLITRAHLSSLDSDVERALSARTVITTK